MAHWRRAAEFSVLKTPIQCARETYGEIVQIAESWRQQQHDDAAIAEEEGTIRGLTRRKYTKNGGGAMAGVIS